MRSTVTYNNCHELTMLMKRNVLGFWISGFPIKVTSLRHCSLTLSCVYWSVSTIKKALRSTTSGMTEHMRKSVCWHVWRPSCQRTCVGTIMMSTLDEYDIAANVSFLKAQNFEMVLVTWSFVCLRPDSMMRASPMTLHT